MLGGLLVITGFARSSQLAAAAYLLAASWLVTVQIWIAADGLVAEVGYALIELVLAVIFLNMARRRWFPVPLFVLHAALLMYQLWTMLFPMDIFWVRLILNRTLEAEILYIALCAIFRIRTLRMTRKRTQ